MLFNFFRNQNQEDKRLSQNLYALLGFYPKSIDIYKTALRHASAGITNEGHVNNNERLEFVGDSIISTIVSDILYKKYPNAKEGKLSVLRAIIVNRKELNKIAAAMHIDSMMFYKNTMKSSMKNMGGNTLEAIVGAIYYDRGYKYCIKFMSKIIDEFFDIDNLMSQNADYKSKLLQVQQKHRLDIAIVTVENVEKDEKNQHFLSEICLNGDFLSEGKGWSKKEAEQVASEQALKKLDSYKI